MAVALIVLVLTASQFLAHCEAAKDVDLSLIKLPPGFSIEKYGEVDSARSLLTTRYKGATITYVSTLTIFTSGDNPSGVWALVDVDNDNKVDYTTLVVDNLDTPNGIVWKTNTLYISGFINNRTQGVIWALEDAANYALNKTTFTGTLPVVTDKLPADIWHGWRYMVNKPRSDELYVAVGVNCNICLLNTTKEGITYASIYSFNVVTKALTQVASGVRNSVGLTVHPRTGDVWFTDNGRDDWGGPNANITDNIPDDELNVIRMSGPRPQNFGYPYCAVEGKGSPYLRRPVAGTDRNDPDVNANGKVKKCQTAKFNRPMQAMGPHTASLGLRFYQWRQGANFPREWHNKLFVAQHGSWNRQLRIGYRVMVLTLNRATDKVLKYQEFATGWLQDAGTKEASVKGRPVDVSQLPDGSLLVSGDTEGIIYRIYYSTPSNTGA